MTHFPPPKRQIYALYGRWLAVAYQCQRRFWGYTWRTWLQWLGVGLLLTAVWSAQPTAVLLLIGLALALLLVGFFWAERAGYMAFVADDGRLSALTPVPPLAAEQRVSLYASGPYAVSDQETAVLLRPATYWQAPNGEHSLMVSQPGNKYLYQFFATADIHQVRAGWLLFGKMARPTIAITFSSHWGPTAADAVTAYMVGGGVSQPKRQPLRTIYLSTSDTAVEAQLWQQWVG